MKIKSSVSIKTVFQIASTMVPIVPNMTSCVNTSISTCVCSSYYTFSVFENDCEVLSSCRSPFLRYVRVKHCDVIRI